MHVNSLFCLTYLSARAPTPSVPIILLAMYIDWLKEINHCLSHTSVYCNFNTITLHISRGLNQTIHLVRVNIGITPNQTMVYTEFYPWFEVINPEGKAGKVYCLKPW